MSIRRSVVFAALVASAALLSACDSAEERAEKHYQSGLKLLEAGDVDRALVEFRNVFKLNNTHRDARMAYARAEESRGKLREAYGQYLRVVEQRPDDIEALKELGELALDSYNWEQAKRHITAAAAIAPDDPLVRAMKATLDYRAAVEAKDEAAEAAALAIATETREALPESLVPRRLLIDSLLRKKDSAAALSEINAALAIKSSDRDLHRLKIALLDENGDDEGVEAHLKEMIALFPDDPSIEQTLVRWYLARKNPEAAEKYLREHTETAGTTDKTGRLTLVRFLAEVRGPETAIRELDAMIAAGGDVTLFKSLRAGLSFDMGQQEAAIAAMQEIVATAEPSAESRQIKLSLARMYVATGDQVSARKLVEEVLAENGTEVEALKLKAGWQIDADQTGDAIVTLRAALDQAPRDPQIMTLMARAHDREGDRALTADMLALATETSNRAPDETQRYARFLIAEKKYLPAEAVLVDALRIVPENVDLLGLLGGVYVELKDWERAEHVIGLLRNLPSREASSLANGLQAAVLTGQSKSDEAMSFLEGLLENDKGNIGVQAAIIRARLNNGDIAAARTYAAEVLATNPTDPSLRFIHASVLEIAGETPKARDEFIRLLSEDPSLEPVWMALYQLETNAGDEAAAEKVLNDALAALPESANLKWAQASLFDKRGQVEEAIAIYDALYTANSSSLLVSNNLASLLSNFRTDEESLQRAYTVARRLRGSDFPPFQDTYGWIAYLRGDTDEALAHLEPSAAGLPDDAMAQYHFAMALLKAGRRDEARTQFEKTVALLPADDTRPFAESARAELAKLTSE